MLISHGDVDPRLVDRTVVLESGRVAACAVPPRRGWRARTHAELRLATPSAGHGAVAGRRAGASGEP